ncbi:hypothetical protein TWF696_004930 [Orbilia brochopaga]|uniref:Uncharacterized protein n=1 Tax=Orbilia brochopaga TaxID=3140254 RepID=A0AAV9V040_9PEZI
MKAALILAVFAAFAAAIPTGGSTGKHKRCNSGNQKCDSDETCVGEYQFKDDPRGICLPSPQKCGGGRTTPDKTCPQDDGKTYRCIPRANVRRECPMDGAYCGYCVQSITVKALGGRRSEGETNRCGGKSGKKCFENPDSPEICAGTDNELRDGMGVCLTWGFTRQCKNGCSPGDHCVKNSCPKFLSGSDCGSSVCLPKQYVQEIGLRGN